MRLACLLLAAALGATPYRGTVVKADREAGVLTVEGADGVRTVAAAGVGDLEIGWEGRPIRAERIESEGRPRLERLFPEDPEAMAEIAAAAAALRRDTVERGRLVARAEGDFAPAFVLWDHHGKLARSGDLRGRPYVLNFIFTRCKAAEMCPASSACMASLGKALREAGLGGKVRLLTITFDPAHDSPGVLRAYAAGMGLDPDHHRLLTGDREMIRDLMRQFGILTLEQDGTIVHNAATVVVSPDGRIVARRPGARFEPEDLMPLLGRLISPR